MPSVAQLRVDAVLDVLRPDSADGVPGGATQANFPYPRHLRRVVRAAEHVREVECDRTVRENRELAARAAERRGGWEQDWINWERHRYARGPTTGIARRRCDRSVRLGAGRRRPTPHA